MKFTKTKLDGVIIVEPDIFFDDRGYFFESYNEKKFHENGITAKFVQDNQSKSCYGVIRGLHAQMGEHAQAKLVRVLQGTVLDIAVDIRQNSPTFGQYIAVELSAENQQQLFIPRGFLHGFAVLSEEVLFTYKCDNFYCKQSEFSVRADDPTLNIDWRVPAEKRLYSDKDKQGAEFKDAFSNWK